MFSPTSTNRTFPYRLPLPRRFPLSRKHRPIRPQRGSMIQHNASLPVMSTIGAGLRVQMDALGAPGWHGLHIECLRDYIIKKHDGKNVVVHALRDEGIHSTTIECRWYSAPRIGHKNRAFLAAHGINV